MPRERLAKTNGYGAMSHAAASVVRQARSTAFAARHWWFTLGLSVFAIIAGVLILTPWTLPA